jgi:hypothetical protein
MDLNKEVLIKKLKQYYIKTDIFSLIYELPKQELNDKPEYFKFKNITYDSLDINKYANSLVISNNFILSKTKTVVTIFKLVRNEKIVNYGFVYGNIINNKVHNNSIVLSLSTISKDGEYKHRLIDYNEIDNMLKIPILNEIYEFLYKNYINKEFDFQFSIYNIVENKILNEYKTLLSNKLILLKYYTIIWITEIYMNNKNEIFVNIDESSFHILCSAKDILFFKKLYNNNKDKIDEIMPEIIYYNSLNRLELGQKILPFNYIQLKEYNHLIHSQWKELIINKIINNLIHNNCSICFSLFIDWILITKSDKNLYNNEEIFKKLYYSDQLKTILNSLYQAKTNLLNLITSNEQHKTINKLEKRLQNLINDTQTSMLMSNISLCFFSEYSGKTIFNHLNLLLNNKVNPLIGNLFTDYNLLNKYIFDIIYSLYCLNLKGIIHGDLHLNNVTLALTKKVDDNSYVVYDLNNSFNLDIVNYIENYPNINKDNNLYSTNSESNDEINNNYQLPNNLNECYQFKHKGYFPSIIDYSRSFILLKLIDTNIIESNKSSIRTKYIQNETKRIINELNKIFPNYIKNNVHKLKFLFKNKNFLILFIYFTAYDTFTFITNLLIFMKKVSISNNIQINPQILELLTSISKKSYYYLEQILNEDNYNFINKHQFPNYSILKEFFPNNQVTPNDLNNKITHYFNLQNINKYYTSNDLKKINKNIITDYINSDLIPDKEKEKVKNKFSNILKYSSNANYELNIEKLINKEYYNIKSNLHLMSSSIKKNDNLDLTYDVTTNSLNVSNY